jgi:hypothetical protein
MKGLSAAWLTYLGVATYQWEKANRGVLPPPSIYLGSSVIFAGLGIVGEAAPGFAAVFAWGLIVAAGVSGAFAQIGQVKVPVGEQGGAGTHGKTPPGARGVRP